jgi:hypothetical protein
VINLDKELKEMEIKLEKSNNGREEERSKFKVERKEYQRQRLNFYFER